MSDVVTGAKFLTVVVAAAAVAVPDIAAPKHETWVHLDIGVPLNVVLAAAFGAFVGVWNKRIEHKGDLIGAFLTSMVLTIGVVAGIPVWTGYEWDSTGYQAAMAMLLGFTSQNWGPLLVEKIGDKFRDFGGGKGGNRAGD